MSFFMLRGGNTCGFSSGWISKLMMNGASMPQPFSSRTCSDAVRVCECTMVVDANRPVTSSGRSSPLSHVKIALRRSFQKVNPSVILVLGRPKNRSWMPSSLFGSMRV